MIGESMPGTFESAIQRAVAGRGSLRTTIPEAVAKILDAEAGGTLIWSFDLKGGRVVVTAEPAPSL